MIVVIADRIDETAEIVVIAVETEVATALAAEAEVAAPSSFETAATGTETEGARATEIEATESHEVIGEMVNAATATVQELPAVTGPLVTADQSIANDRFVIIIFDEDDDDDETNKMVWVNHRLCAYTLTEALYCLAYLCPREARTLAGRAKEAVG